MSHKMELLRPMGSQRFLRVGFRVASLRLRRLSWEGSS